jgi:hypothetical protein
VSFKRILPFLLLAGGLALLLAGLYPRLQGGSFNSAFFPPAVTLLVVGGAVRRRQRMEREREEAGGGR